MTRPAFSILEIIIALALFGIILLTVGVYGSFGLTKLSSRQNFIQAEALVVEAQTVLNVIAKRDWALFNESVGSLQFNNNQWEFGGTGTVEQIGLFKRMIKVSPVCRNADQAAVDCAQGTVDSGTFKILIKVSWSDWSGEQEIARESYLGQWR